MTFRVAIAGFGAIGKVVAQRLDQGIEGLTLTAVAARDVARAEAAMAGFARPVPVVPLARLWEHADVVVECAPAALFRGLAEPALGGGIQHGDGAGEEVHAMPMGWRAQVCGLR